jgi:pimeloyl-ACP methyl ester carboxylesterase
MDFTTVRNGEIALNVAVQGEGPLILCVHGWPELWYSWRHQLAHFAPLGFKVAALDVRGYGGSSRPPEIEAYSMKRLTSDVAAVIDALGGGEAILLGHDWGAPIVWNTALLQPRKVRAVAGLSVPYIPRGQSSFLTLAKALYAGKFFYQLYFLTPGVAEAELEADVAASLRKTYFSISGDAPADMWTRAKPADAGFLDGMIDPDPLPPWLTEADLAVFVAAFEKSGFRGSLNRYRAQDIDFEDLAHLAGQKVAQPSYFVGGERDAVRRFVPGVDLYADPGVACADFRGATIVPKVGHWVQQEAPAATNAALEAFVKGL